MCRHALNQQASIFRSNNRFDSAEPIYDYCKFFCDTIKSEKYLEHTFDANYSVFRNRITKLCVYYIYVYVYIYTYIHTYNIYIYIIIYIYKILVEVVEHGNLAH